MSAIRLSSPLHHCPTRRRSSSASASAENSARFPFTPARLCCRFDSLRLRPIRAGLSSSSSSAEAERGDSDVAPLCEKTFSLHRTQTVAGKVTVRVEKSSGGGRKITVGCDLDGKWLLHWGVTYRDEIGTSEWDQPPTEMRPPGSVPIKDYAVETPLKKSSPGSEAQFFHEVQINLDDSSSPIAAINFVLKDEETSIWYQHKGRDFRIPLIGTSVGGQRGFSIWPGTLTQMSSFLLKSEPNPTIEEIATEAEESKVEFKLLESFSEEYPLLKEVPVQNSITVMVKKGEYDDKKILHLETDVPGQVIIHWGVCKGGNKTWEVPSPPHPPHSKMFRRKALQTLLQQKADVGNWGSFPLDEDASGVLFVIKLSEYNWLNNMGNDFYIPLELHAQDIDGEKDRAELRLVEKEITEGVVEDSVEILREASLRDEPQEKKETSYTDGIINGIRSLVCDISSGRSMRTKSNEERESILQEIDKLAAEAYGIFRSSSPIFVEDLISEAELLKTSVEICSGTGTGYEILCQGFNWESNKSGRWYADLAAKVSNLADFGITTIWLPPPTESVSSEGYMPRDLYNLNSRYGTVEELKDLVRVLHDEGISALGDVVLNHRCAHHQNQNGVWNIFGGCLNWDDRAIVSDDPHFQGRGNKSSGDFFHAAPNIDHSQEFVRRDLKEWLCWLREEIGYDGWRLDFVRGFWGGYVKDYIEASSPFFAVGEYWDSLSYTYGQMDYNQDSHRQRIIDWINATNGSAGAFDVTTKGILHSALEKCEYWRLSDEKGKPPGVLGWWPSRAVTFIENHDTGSTQGHWRFPAGKEMQGYAYIFTHPGTPTVFYDHLFSHYQQEIVNLISVRRKAKLHSRSMVNILKAHADVYAAEIDEKIAVKIGSGYFEPSGGRKWSVAAEGNDYKVWESI